MSNTRNIVIMFSDNTWTQITVPVEASVTYCVTNEAEELRKVAVSWAIGEIEGARSISISKARLQAAAPEMYAALESIAAMTDADDDGSYRADDREGCLDTVYAVAKAALRKADGVVKHNGTEEE